MGIDPVSIGLTVGAGLVSAYGAEQGGEAAQDAAGYRAQVARNNAIVEQQNAEFETQSGDIAVTNQGLKTRAGVGAIKTAQAGNNIDVETGSAKEVQTAAGALGQLDALTIRSNAQKRAQGHLAAATSDNAQAQLDEMQGEQAKRAGDIGALSSLISSAASVGSKFKNFQSSPSVASAGSDPWAGLREVS